MPYDDSNIKKMIRYQTERKVGFSKHKKLSMEVKAVIHAMLEADISKRAKVEQILHSEWMRPRLDQFEQDEWQLAAELGIRLVDPVTGAENLPPVAQPPLEQNRFSPAINSTETKTGTVQGEAGNDVVTYVSEYAAPERLATPRPETRPPQTPPRQVPAPTGNQAPSAVQTTQSPLVQQDIVRQNTVVNGTGAHPEPPSSGASNSSTNQRRFPRNLFRKKPSPPANTADGTAPLSPVTPQPNAHRAITPRPSSPRQDDNNNMV